VPTPSKLITISKDRLVGTISPLLFGHNLEHTRRVLFQGLCAEMLRGRKFTGTVRPPGVAEPWYPIGGRKCHFQVERGWGNWGMQGEPYTEHFDHQVDPRKAGIFCQTVRAYSRSERVGIGQGGLGLEKGRRYAGFVALRSEQSAAVDVRIGSGSGGETCFRTTLRLEEKKRWGDYGFEFVCPGSDDGARLELTVSARCAFSVGAVSLRPADTFHGMRTDVVDLMQRISVPILRWPGGNFAGCYRWRDGLLPVHRRAPLPAGGILPYSHGHDDHEIGTDEFIALCRKLGAEPWITINMSIEGPPDAGAWVEYCNGSADTQWGSRRAERGSAEPYDVRFWSLGNEMGYGHMRGPNTPEEYGRCAVECAAAMKEVDPTIVLVASGAWGREEWFSEVLSKCAEHFDHISCHEYTPLIKDFSRDKGPGEIRRLAAAPSSTTLDGLRLASERAKAHAPSGKSIGISFDEWNVWHTWFGNPGVAEGIHAAAMLNMFCREAHRIGLAIGAYFEPVNEGAIRVDKGSAELTPAGRVFELFKAHHGNERVQVPSPASSDDVDVAASYDRDQGDIVITAVNRNPVSAVAVLITFEGARTISKISGKVLASKETTPGSDFIPQTLGAAKKGDDRVEMDMPPCTVVLLRVSTG
jgi:alpha-L-arabinofuranosidase